MQGVATSLLAAMTLIFVAATLYESHWPVLAYLRAFAESAMVGACADWFAVVALFRHPLGIPIPHTAILPRNKNKIGENFGRFISNNFLAPKEITEKLEKLDVAGWASHWLSVPENAEQVSRRIVVLLPAFLEVFSREQLQLFGSGLIRKGIDSLAAAPLIARTLSVAITHSYHDVVFDRGLIVAESFIAGHREAIRQRVAKSSTRWLPTWVDTKVTDAFLEELSQNLRAASASDHPWRLEFEVWLRSLVGQLRDDSELIERCEVLKTDVLNQRLVDDYLKWLAGEIETTAKNEISDAHGLVSRSLIDGLIAVGHWLKDDDETRTLLNGWVKQIVLETLVPNRAQVGNFVAEVVARWDAGTFVDRLEFQVGRDLQYIRINGTIIGGLVGLGIFCLGRLIS